MAGDWIKMRCNLDTDWRVIQIASQLEMSELHVVGASGNCGRGPTKTPQTVTL